VCGCGGVQTRPTQTFHSSPSPDTSPAQPSLAHHTSLPAGAPSSRTAPNASGDGRRRRGVGGGFAVSHQSHPHAQPRDATRGRDGTGVSRSWARSGLPSLRAKRPSLPRILSHRPQELSGGVVLFSVSRRSQIRLPSSLDRFVVDLFSCRFPFVNARPISYEAFLLIVCLIFNLLYG
jgi:hypothetical protein